MDNLSLFLIISAMFKVVPFVLSSPPVRFKAFIVVNTIAYLSARNPHTFVSKQPFLSMSI
jgi:hypothetical protein